MSIKEKVRKFILDELMESGFDSNIKDDESLIDSAILDSMAILQLISFMDEEFEILPEEGEINSEEISTINRIAQFISKKLNE